MADVIAVILSGGLGTRLRKSLMGKPKVMASVNGRPFVSYLLDALDQFGIKKVVICTGFMADYVERSLGYVHGNMSLIYSKEDEQLGTGGALKLAEPHLGNEGVLVMNGDSFVELNIRDFVIWHREKDSKISVVVTRVENASRYGCVDVDEEGRITTFIEKNKRARTGLINAGIYYLSHEIIRGIPSGRPYSLEYDVFPRYCSDRIFGYQTSGKFIDIGTPETYAMASVFLNSVSTNLATNPISKGD